MGGGIFFNWSYHYVGDSLNELRFFSIVFFQVPILLILAGSIALQRPTPEVAEPLVVTNVYIVFDARK